MVRSLAAQAWKWINSGGRKIHQAAAFFWVRNDEDQKEGSGRIVKEVDLVTVG